MDAPDQMFSRGLPRTCPASSTIAPEGKKNQSNTSAISPAISPKTQSKQYERHQRSRLNWDRQHALVKFPRRPPHPRHQLRAEYTGNPMTLVPPVSTPSAVSLGGCAVSGLQVVLAVVVAPSPGVSQSRRGVLPYLRCPQRRHCVYAPVFK
jgi:hypothetical protein